MVSPFRELTEAALWAIEREVAASETLSRWALAVGRPWGLGCAALLAEGADAGELYRESFSQPGQCRVAVDLALTCSTAKGSARPSDWLSAAGQELWR